MLRSSLAWKWLGLVALVTVLLHASSRPTSTAQEPAKPSARQTLRQRIADCRGEVSLREVEHEVAREALKQRLMTPPTLPESIQGLREALGTARRIGSSKVFDAAEKTEWLDAMRKDCGKDAPLEKLSKALDEAVKAKEFDAAYRVTLKWLEGAETWSKARLDGDLVKAKKEFVNQASALYSKRMEMEDLEKQYRDSR